MLKFLTCSVIALLAFAPPGRAQEKHYGKLGDLVVTATAVTTTLAREEGERYVAVFVRIRYGGTDTACASLSVKMKGTDNLEYAEFSRSPSDFRWPNRPRVFQMSHGQESNGAYVFDVKSGVDPLELTLKLDSQSTDCNADPIGALEDAAHSEDLDLDVHDLSAPVSAENVPGAGFPNGGAGGYSFPRCTYCPRAPYTTEAMRARIEGTVVLFVVVTPDGTATNILVKKGVGYGLDAEAVKTVSTWRFRPAYGPDGKPAAVRQVIEMTFSLHR